MPDVTVVVPTRNRVEVLPTGAARWIHLKDYLERCIRNRSAARSSNGATDG